MTVNTKPTKAQWALLKRMAQGINILYRRQQYFTMGLQLHGNEHRLEEADVMDLVERGWVEPTTLGYRISEAGRNAIGGRR